MEKVKNTVWTVFITFIILSVLCMTPVYAAYNPKHQDYTGLSSDYTLTGQAAKLQTFVTYSVLSSAVSDHEDSGKFVWCAPYTISGSSYIQGTSKTSGYVTNIVAHTLGDGLITIDSSTAKAVYLGNIYLTSSINSGVLEEVRIRTYRSGAPHY